KLREGVERLVLPNPVVPDGHHFVIRRDWHGHDLLGELLAGHRDALVGAQRERDLLLARDAVLLGQDFGRLSHVQAADRVGRPDPQRRLTVNAGTEGGTPARSAATRATLTALGGWAMFPKMTSSSSPGSKDARASTSTVTIRPRSCAGTSFNSVFALAYGVRTPSTMTTSRDMRPFG